MGYCTDFCLEVEDVSPDVENAICEEIKNLNIFQDGDYIYGWGGYVSWYSCDEDMVALSKRFPGVLFTLTGHGDNADDIWRTFYKDGLLQTDCADIIYKDFDETKLHPL